MTGTAGLVARAGKTLDAAVEAGDQFVTAQRAASISGRAASRFRDIATLIQDSRLMPHALANPFAAAGKLFSDFDNTMRPLASTMVSGIEETSAWARIFSGGEEPANYVVRMRMLLAKFPDSTEIAQLGDKFAGEIRTLRAVIGAGTAVTSSSITAAGIVPVSLPGDHNWQPYRVGPWDRLEEKMTHALTAADVIAFAEVSSRIW